jgi:hypothetical protein
MARTPRFKVYDPDNTYIASVFHPEDAAMIIAGNGGQEGWTIRLGHSRRFTVWTEGVDGIAGQSYDFVADTVWPRVEGS